MQTTKQLSKDALQIAVKRREAKNKGEKERYIHLNVEFQKIARKDKKEDQRSQENQRYQGNISRKDGFDKGQKWYGPNRSRRY